ncbi:MAG: hypothetical protein KAS39_02530, partial [Actinomycetia bacterium]|nr:hypothetical protein [Actinomycetes bacterium]
MKEKLIEVLEKAIKSSSAEQSEVLSVITDSSLTRFADNTIHQNVTEKNARISLRVIKDKKIGYASTNDLSIAGLKESLAKAISVTDFLPQKKDFKTLPKPKPIKKVITFDRETASFNHFKRADVIKKIVKKAE